MTISILCFYSHICTKFALMINYDTKTWFSHVIRFHKSDAITIIWKELVLIIAFTIGVTYIEINYMQKSEVFSNAISVYSLVGFVLSLLLVFRTNTAYDRWWEGRKMWGSLVNTSRNLAVKVNNLVDDEEISQYFSRMIPNFVFAMKDHLRDGVVLEELELNSEEADLLGTKEHIPSAIVDLMYKKLKVLKENGRISDIDFMVIDGNLNSLLDILGACERIKNTPIPFSYSLFLKRFIFIYVTTLPLGFVSTFGYYTAFVAGFIFYALVGMEVIAEEIEDPFGKDTNDLPTDELAEKIKANVIEILS